MFLSFPFPFSVSFFSYISSIFPNPVAPGPNILRDLTLLSKVLQTIANGVAFTVKEPYLIPMNEFIHEHQGSVLDFLDALCEVTIPLFTHSILSYLPIIFIVSHFPWSFPFNEVVRFQIHE